MPLLTLKQEFERLVGKTERHTVDYYIQYLMKRKAEIERAKAKLELLKAAAHTLPATPMNRAKVVLVRRGNKVFFRAPPRKPPTPPKLKTWELMAKLTKLASEMTYEEVAELVGGKVVDVGEHLKNPKLKGKKAVFVDGQLLTKAQAIMKLVKGKRWSVPKTFEERVLEVLRKAGLEV